MIFVVVRITKRGIVLRLAFGKTKTYQQCGIFVQTPSKRALLEPEVLVPLTVK